MQSVDRFPKRDIARAESVLQLFLIVYRYLERTQRWEAILGHEDELRTPAADQLKTRWRSDVCAALTNAPPAHVTDYFLAVGRMRRKLSAAEVAAKLLTGLRAIDSALVGAYAFAIDELDRPDGRAGLRTRLRLGQPYEVWKDLALYPKPGAAVYRAGIRGQYLRDLFAYLCVVSTSKASGRIPVSYLVNPMPPAGMDPFERVGLIPVVLDPEEVEWSLERNERYGVRIQPALIREIEARVIDALDWLMVRKPGIVLLPELASDPVIAASIKRYLRNRAERRLYTPSLVLCGTWLAPDGQGHRNRALVVGADGADLWTQNKMHAYYFSAPEQERAGSPLREAHLVGRTEAIEVYPRKIVVYDLSPEHRCAVLICEDFQQDSSATALADWGVTLLLVPVMNEAIESDAWVTKRAIYLSLRPGASSVVLNSGTLVEPRLAPRNDAASVASQLSRIIGSPRVAVDWETFMPDDSIHPWAILGTVIPEPALGSSGVDMD